MSQDKIDNRIIEVGFEIDGQIERFRDLYITANGTKFANENQNECEIVIANLDKATRDYLVTATSPFNKSASPKKFFLSAGRESTGISQIYTGDISSVEVSQPPDIKVKWKTLTGNDKKNKSNNGYPWGEFDFIRNKQTDFRKLGAEIELSSLR